MKISIILPTFNRSQILKETIYDIQNQTFENYELIIINDASTDNTLKVIQEFNKKDSRIKIINNKENYGCAKSREIGLSHSKNEIIVFIDDDDKWNNQKLKKQYDAMMHKNSDIVISDYNILIDKKKIYKKMYAFSQNFKQNILEKPGPFFQCVMIKKKIIQKMNNPFDTKSVPSEDWNFFIELSKLNPTVSYINEALFTWKIHSDNQSLNLEKEAIALEYIINKHYDYIKSECNVKVLANHYRRIARIYEKQYNLKNIKRLYIKAFQINPMSIKNIFYYILVLIGYQYSQFIISGVRKLRGMKNA